MSGPVGRWWCFCCTSIPLPPRLQHKGDGSVVLMWVLRLLCFHGRLSMATGDEPWLHTAARVAKVPSPSSRVPFGLDLLLRSRDKTMLNKFLFCLAPFSFLFFLLVPAMLRCSEQRRAAHPHDEAALPGGGPVLQGGAGAVGEKAVGPGQNHGPTGQGGGVPRSQPGWETGLFVFWRAARGDVNIDPSGCVQAFPRAAAGRSGSSFPTSTGCVTGCPSAIKPRTPPTKTCWSSSLRSSTPSWWI